MLNLNPSGHLSDVSSAVVSVDIGADQGAVRAPLAAASTTQRALLETLFNCTLGYGSLTSTERACCPNK